MAKYKVVKSIKREQYPVTSTKKYRTAHEEATEAEKKKFPRKNYNALKKIDATTPSKQLVGVNKKSGKVEVAKRVPKKLRKEVAFHEKYESNVMKRLAKKGKKS